MITVGTFSETIYEVRQRKVSIDGERLSHRIFRLFETGRFIEIPTIQMVTNQRVRERGPCLCSLKVRRNRHRFFKSRSQDLADKRRVLWAIVGERLGTR